MSHILVIGGAGYIGSSVCARLLDEGHQVSIIDDLSTGRKELVLSDQFFQARASDLSALRSVLKDRPIDCVMHLAGRAIVAESFEKPEEYFENNLTQTELLLENLLSLGVNNFIFSSTCSVFGNSKHTLIDELQPKFPVSPYGESKLAAELLIEKLTKTRGLKAIILRYFNAAGADPKGRTGEWHEAETRLIPKVLKAARENSELPIWGMDYPTPDGTCIRDYVHVWDLAKAHIQAMELLAQQKMSFESFNLGSGRGHSVLEIVNAVEIASQQKILIKKMPRRRGDPAEAVASIQKAQQILNFKREYSDLDNIIKSAISWDTKKRRLGK